MFLQRDQLLLHLRLKVREPECYARKRTWLRNLTNRSRKVMLHYRRIGDEILNQPFKKTKKYSLKAQCVTFK